MSRASEAIVCSADTAGIAAVAPSATLRLKGFSVAETAASAATAEVQIKQGTTSAGTLLAAPINLAADGSAIWWLGEDGVDANGGIYVDRISGNTALVLYITRS